MAAFNLPENKLYFNSRPHEEVDFAVPTIPPNTVLFQLTTSRGGRRYWAVSVKVGIKISTHDLTRRSTLKRVVCGILKGISTHDLTRRSTQGRRYK